MILEAVRDVLVCAGLTAGLVAVAVVLRIAGWGRL